MDEKNIRNAYRRSFENIGASEEFKNRTLEKMMAISAETAKTEPVRVRKNTVKNIAFSKYIVGLTAAAACAVLTVAVIRNSPDRLASTTKSELDSNYVTVYEPVDGEADEYIAPHNNSDDVKTPVYDERSAENAEEYETEEEEEVLAGGADEETAEDPDEQPAETSVTTTAAENRAETTAQTDVQTAAAAAEAVLETQAAAVTLPPETAPGASDETRQRKKKDTAETEVSSAAYLVAPAAPDEAPAAETQSTDNDTDKTAEAVFYTDGESFDSIIGFDGEIVEEADSGDTYGVPTDPVVTGITGVPMPAEVIVNQAEENSPEDFRSRLTGGIAVIQLKGNIDDKFTLKRDDSTLIISALTEHTGGHTISLEAPGGYDYIVDVQSPKDFLRFYVSADTITVRTADDRGIIYVSYPNNTAKPTVESIINN